MHHLELWLCHWWVGQIMVCSFYLVQTFVYLTHPKATLTLLRRLLKMFQMFNNLWELQLDLILFSLQQPFYGLSQLVFYTQALLWNLGPQDWLCIIKMDCKSRKFKHGDVYPYRKHNITYHFLLLIDPQVFCYRCHIFS